MIQEQGATILNYADKRTQLNFAGIEINRYGSTLTSFIITLAPVFAWLWIKLGKASRQFLKILRFIVRRFIIPGYPASCLFRWIRRTVNPLWLVLSYFLCSTWRALHASWISATTKLAPAAFSAQHEPVVLACSSTSTERKSLDSTHLKPKWLILE
jgi:POT family proton-dependent oligopeptide transporter